MRTRHRLPVLTALMRGVAASLTMAVAIAAPATARADASTWPSQPIRMVIPTAVGGNHDLLARLIGEKLTGAWGQQIIVDARPGANGMLATSAVAKAPADGYTVLFSISALIQNVLLQPNPPYKLSDLAPVSLVANYPVGIAATATLPIYTIGDFVKMAKEKPGTLSYGSYGVGSSGHIIGAGLARAAGIQTIHVPYKGEAASFSDLVSGQLTIGYGSVGFYARQITTGKVRLIAVTNATRLKTFPDVPTMAEAGYPGVNLPGWAGLLVPTGTPKDVIAKFSKEVARVLALPDVQAKIYDMGFEPNGSTPEAFADQMKVEYGKWEAVIKENDIKLE
ncbi:MAG: bug [Rhizobacter sp.]|nr:bug [Rhizobacter sp.]